MGGNGPALLCKINLSRGCFGCQRLRSGRKGYSSIRAMVRSEDVQEVLLSTSGTINQGVTNRVYRKCLDPPSSLYHLFSIVYYSVMTLLFAYFMFLLLTAVLL